MTTLMNNGIGPHLQSLVISFIHIHHSIEVRESSLGLFCDALAGVRWIFRFHLALYYANRQPHFANRMKFNFSAKSVRLEVSFSRLIQIGTRWLIFGPHSHFHWSLINKFGVGTPHKYYNCLSFQFRCVQNET